MNLLLIKLYSHLFSSFGPQQWWPGDGPLEISVGAILTQNTNWENAFESIRILKDQRVLNPQVIRNMNHSSLSQLIRSSGYYNQKARKLKCFMEWLSHYQDNWEKIRKRSLHKLRRELLSIWGIGEETADSILLYAFDKPVFVIDSYTRRIFSRHNLCSSNISYHDLQHLFMKHLPADSQLYNEYHALLVKLGKTYCRKQAKCEGCPLFRFNFTQ